MGEATDGDMLADGMTATTPCMVSIVEDDPVARDSLRELVQQAAGVRCLSVFGTAEEALEQLPGQKPNVVLMDINLPKMSGIECVSLLKQRCPEIQVLMLTVYEKPDLVFQALRAGASGYLVKRAVSRHLADAIRDVRFGGSPMSSHIARKVVQYFHELGPASNDLVRLSAREREILEMLADGDLYKEIADKLAIGITTVRTHLQHIYEKLHVRTRSEAVAKYLRP
jgi:DNA-binding NarL/FixJ family response regulator